MDDLRVRGLDVAAGRLKESAAAQNVYVSLDRARRMMAPVLDAVTPYLLSHESIERVRAADAAVAAGAVPAPLETPLTAADHPELRAERLRATVRRIERAAALHDLSDIAIHTLPAEMRTMMLAYADCQMHLKKASSLLRVMIDTPLAETPAKGAVVRTVKRAAAGKYSERAKQERVVEPVAVA